MAMFGFYNFSPLSVSFLQKGGCLCFFLHFLAGCWSIDQIINLLLLAKKIWHCRCTGEHKGNVGIICIIITCDFVILAQ